MKFKSTSVKVKTTEEMQNIGGLIASFATPNLVIGLNGECCP